MAELRKERLASAKKRLKQYQQKGRDCESESGRSTPSQRKLEDEEGTPKTLQSENGGSTYSLSQSENLSSNISGTESPVLNVDYNLDNINQVLNGNSQPDLLNVFNNMPKSSESLFNTSPHSFFAEILPPGNSQSGSDFFDNLSSGSGPPLGLSHGSASNQNVDLVIPVMNTVSCHASTPDGPLFVDTPNYSFPDLAVSPIQEMKNNMSVEAVTSELENKLKSACTRNSELDHQLNEKDYHITQLQTEVEELKKKVYDGSSALKNYVQAIEILVSEKTELQNALEKQQDEVKKKTGEVEECQGRLRASRHRVTDLERDLSSTKAHLQSLNALHTDLSAQHTSLLQQTDSLGKRITDLELEVSDLHNKLDSRDQMLSAHRAELDEKTSQLSLADVKIQQLSGGTVPNGALEEELQQKSDDMTKLIKDLESQLETSRVSNEDSMKEYQRYVSRLHVELQELKTENENCGEQARQTEVREQALVHQLSELERRLQRAPPPSPSNLDGEPAVQEQLALTQQDCQALKAQLQDKITEIECLRLGLQERAIRIQELEMTVERLETECPNTVNLQAAIESDKVAASRAVAQNNNLKKQLEELQEALVKLSNSKLELTQQLQHEQHLRRDLSEKLERIQDLKTADVEKAQQTDHPILQENEAQTNNLQPVVNPEAMGKLEEKFRKTMEELADLSDEKQRLEHLVLQLQSETETIGEYITLYRIQRGMLRQRAQEKDEQVAKLAEDKEALRNKLAQLNCLVQRLVGVQVNGHDPGEVSEMKPTTETSELPSIHNTMNVETAEQIRSLLTEIGSNNLVTSSVGENTNINFHPCPWCSGRLITI